ncbi:actin-related protein 2/3 complex subunit 1A-like [Liolophura sinensis]|uniref:actin-related protein 2/3 complex subunit 1A-like n=1 Tax=Liolophura sinensis TaxID=3198878 RepID=UPI003158A05D
MTSVHNFGVLPVTCHTWNKNRSELALSLSGTEVKIYAKDGSGWKETQTLTEHAQRVTGIDWAPNSNRIVTCGADRNAYVWTFSDGKWKPTLVILRINRAATFVKWSPQENKFAVGSGARVVSVCYFDKDNDWWVSKHIKKPIRSTVTSLDWHPNNILLACGSTDFKCRVFSGYLKEVESKPSANHWGTKFNFGNLLAEFSTGGGGWVHSVSFSASGDKLAWVGHDSSVAVVNGADGLKLSFVKTEFLPFMGCSWVSENSLVCVGYDCNPMVYSYADNGRLTFVSKLDIPKEKEGGTVSAMKRFQDLDKKAAVDDSSTDLKTLHKNTILQVTVHSGTKADATKVSTSAVDGNIIIWDFKSLERSISGLKI